MKIPCALKITILALSLLLCSAPATVVAMSGSQAGITINFVDATRTIQNSVHNVPQAFLDAAQNISCDQNATNNEIDISLITYADWQTYVQPFMADIIALQHNHNIKQHHQNIATAIGQWGNADLNRLMLIADFFSLQSLQKNAQKEIVNRINKSQSFDWLTLPEHIKSSIAHKLASSALNYMQAQNITLGKTLTGHSYSVKSVAFSPDGKQLASGSWDDTIKLWDVNTGQLLNTLTGHHSWVNSVTFSPDGKHLASGSLDNTVKLWDAATGQLLNTLTGHTRRIKSVAFSPDSTTLASGSADNTVKLWDVNTGKLLNTLTGHLHSVKSVAFSPDGKQLASGSWDDTIKLWDVNTGQLLNTLTGHHSWVNSVTFSPDGKQLASGSLDNTIKLWNATTGQLLRTLTEHTDSVKSVAFSTNGNQLASGSLDNTIKLWNATSGKLIRTLTGHSDSVSSVAFSYDGNQLASGSIDETIKLWSIPSVANLQLTIKQAELLNRAYQSNNHSITICYKCNKDDHTTYQTFDAETKNLAKPLITTQTSCLSCRKRTTQAMGIALGAIITGLQAWHWLNKK